MSQINEKTCVENDCCKQSSCFDEKSCNSKDNETSINEENMKEKCCGCNCNSNPVENSEISEDLDNIDHENKETEAIVDTIEEVNKLQEEIATLKEKVLVIKAEQENVVRRTQRDADRLIMQAERKIILAFLNIIDPFYAGIEYAETLESQDAKMLVTGFSLVRTQIEHFLRSKNITGFQSIGETFDPLKHESISVVESDLDNDHEIITKEFMRGYKIGNEILRPAKVEVMKAKSKN